MPNKFKVGDIVKVLKNSRYHPKNYIGKIYTITPSVESGELSLQQATKAERFFFYMNGPGVYNGF